MNICNICNKINKIIGYTICGSTKDTYNQKEYTLIEAMITIFIFGIIGFFVVIWWLVPIQFLINQLNLRNITFKCNKKWGFMPISLIDAFKIKNLKNINTAIESPIVSPIQSPIIFPEGMHDEG